MSNLTRFIASLLLASLLIALIYPRPAQATSYNSITIDGNCSDWAADEKFSGNDGDQTWITWDASNIYIGWLAGGDWLCVSEVIWLC